VSDTARDEDGPLRLGVSSCLLGNAVRYDGGHKRDRFLSDLLGGFVEWVPVCPEVEVGMGVPRPAVHLVRTGADVRMREVASGSDHTRRMRDYAVRRVRELASLELCGYVLKKDSPSCGMTRVRVHGDDGRVRREGIGLYASALLEAFPNLPIEDEGRLQDPRRRENFIERVFAYARVCRLFRSGWRHAQVVAFHGAHELQLQAHSPSAYRALGCLVAEPRRIGRAAFRERYASGFMDALRRPASRRRNARVLQKAAGRLARSLDAASRAELRDLIDDYRRGLLPLVVPVTRIAHHVRRHGVASLVGQRFLEPHPWELRLRNHTRGSASAQRAVGERSSSS
jgi:uncharacterized protein YbgA (DUF1722 family)/uncharacterized protein YbbK (DUF523 family)